MSLQLIATPIGNKGDITLRAIDALKSADVVIGEERREVSTLLKHLGFNGKRLELLNEHSKDEDVAELLALCREMNVALVTDCGTPGFCDPGARLVAACRKENISVTTLPGASSLMCLLSMAGQNWSEFVFRGFLPAEREARSKALHELKNEQRAIILMDTPYRLTKLLGELSVQMPERRALLGCDFTQETEKILEGTLKELTTKIGEMKAEFILALQPIGTALSAQKIVVQPKKRAQTRPSPITQRR